MKHKYVPVISAAFAILAMVLNVGPVSAATTYSATASPGTINLGEPTTITVSIATTGTVQYNLTITVTKPDGTSSSSVSPAILTSVSGSGSGTVTYPTDPWSDVSGTSHNSDSWEPTQ